MYIACVITVLFLGILASIVNLLTTWGIIGIILSVILILGVVIYIYLRWDWEYIKRMVAILNTARIPITMIALLGITFLGVDQIKDAIIALGDFDISVWVKFSLISILWASFIWLFTGTLLSMKYPNPGGAEKALIKKLPFILVATSFLLMSIAFFIQGLGLFSNMGICLIFWSIFLFLVYLLGEGISQKISAFKNPGETTNGMIPMKNLPVWLWTILLILFCISLALLVFWLIGLLLGLIFIPINVSILLGSGVTILVLCFCIWLPILCLIQYYSDICRKPLFIFLLIIIAGFSLFNGNKDVRFVKSSHQQRENIKAYYDKWVEQYHGSQDKPLIIVLSEGGGIRASYWSAKLLAKIQIKYPEFRNRLFCISSISGGSFGATVFDSLLKYYDNSKKEKYDELDKLTKEIIGKDYLSPVIASLFTGEMVQMILPVPISSLDPAKVFEKTWEFHWENIIKGEGANKFSDPFLSLWQNNSKNIPPLFLNTAQVENGSPVVVGSFTYAENDQIHKDFYNDIIKTGDDIPISTASLLSARFPFIGPAGTLTNKNNQIIGLVDGGYYDDTGAITAYQILCALEKSGKLKDVQPIIVYLQNEEPTTDENSGRSMLYQLFAPIITLFHTRDMHSRDAVSQLKEFIRNKGKFITYSLNEKQPLGWALSEKAQHEIDKAVEKIKIDNLKEFLDK